jgi:hypothetical protein
VAGVVAGQRDSGHPRCKGGVALDLLELDRVERPRHVVSTAAVAGEGKRIAVDDVAGIREERPTVDVRVPADVVDVEVREEDDVDLLGLDSLGGERVRQPAFHLALPLVPEARRADAGVDDDGLPGTPDHVADACKAEVGAGEGRWVRRAVRRPIVREREELIQRAQAARRIEQRADPDLARYHLTRSGASSPCASCQEITGFRSTPIRSISASITSPGFR